MFGIMKYFYQHIEGAILGSVVGDALGVPDNILRSVECRWISYRNDCNNIHHRFH